MIRDSDIQQRIAFAAIAILLPRARNNVHRVPGSSVDAVDVDLSLTVLEVEKAWRNSRYWVILICNESESIAKLCIKNSIRCNQ